ncbi:unnamed protein product [Rotaria sp. Silwood1]|nr:unnamed protein product [Rotaria sp. Silwood1]
MTDNKNSKRRIFIREHVYKRDNYLDEVEYEFIDDFESNSSIEQNYSLWLRRDHYMKTILRRYGYSENKMPTFEEYIDTIRSLIVGHCCSEYDLRRAFHIFDLDQNGIIELHEFYQFISIIGRSTTEDKISNFIERINISDDRNLNYEQFKQFVRLGHGREMLVNVSL